jgi:hypothetical protein
MKMKYTLTMMLLALASMSAFGQSLKDTTQWLENFSAYHGAWVNDDGSIAFEHLDINECSVTDRVFSLDKNGVPDPADFGDKHAHFEFSFSDLDPNTVKTNVPLDHHSVHAYTEFETTDAKPKIGLCGQVNVNGTEKTSCGPFTRLSINLDNEADADRFTKAFKHAVILCGGKPSTF